MMKRILIIVVLVILIPTITIASADDVDGSGLNIDDIIRGQLDNLKINELEELIDNINNDSQQLLPKIDLTQYLIALVKGEQVVDGKEILNNIFRIVFNEVIANSTLLVKLLVLTIICAVLTNLQSSFEKDTVGQLAFYVCYIVLMVVSIQAFTIGLNIGRAAIENMVIFIQVLLPVLITLLLAMGGFTSSALFQPVILGSISVITTLMKDVLLPLIFFSGIIGIVSKISNKIQINKISGLLRQISIAILGVTMTIFIGIISIQGITAAKVDGITIKTAKFAVDKFIPIVGKFLSDAMDTVVGCSMLLKNAVGVIGLIALFVICIMPIIKIVAIIFIFKATSAVIEPISDERIVDCLNDISKSMLFILSTVLAVGMMFFIAITIIVSAGNMTVMLR